MKSIFILILSLSFTLSYGQFNRLVWADEFNGNELDLTKWAHENGNGCPNLCGWGNGELQTYTENEQNIRVENGLLTITATRENVGQSSFTSSKLRTLGLHAWTYGRFEARMRLPLGLGLWPAFWMLSINNDWPMTGEIDIMEYRGDIPTETHGTLHYGAPWPNNRYDGTTYNHSESLSDDFHVYAVEWEENEIRWYFDGILFKTATKTPNSLSPPSNGDIAWPWDSDFYIILNLAVGGGFTGNPGTNEIQLTKPTFEIDYVRVYSEGCGNSVSISGPNQVFTQKNITYSTTYLENASYNWQVTDGGTIVNGQGTNSIEVMWETETEATLSLTMTPPNDCPDEIIETHLSVLVSEETCESLYEDFEDDPTISFSSGNGSIVPNSNKNSVNNSDNSYQYNRSFDSQYDVVFIDDLFLSNGADFENETFLLEMDVFTSAAVGTPIQLQLASTANWQDSWPNGRHSVYTATTTTTSQWETLTFHFSEAGDPNRAVYENNLDRIVVLVHPNSYTGATYLLDNIRKVASNPQACTVTGTDRLPEAKPHIYPQPTKDVVTVRLPSTINTSHATLLDVNGRVLQQLIVKDLDQVDLTELHKGLYFLQLVTPHSNITFKVFKND